MGCALNLIALGVGYLVFLNATKEKGGIKDFGRVVGIVIMIGAIASGICGAMKCKYLKGQCDMMGKNCPMMSKANCPMPSAPGDADK